VVYKTEEKGKGKCFFNGYEVSVLQVEKLPEIGWLYSDVSILSTTEL
jgi:hypothetical protein